MNNNYKGILIIFLSLLLCGCSTITAEQPKAEVLDKVIAIEDTREEKEIEKDEKEYKKEYAKEYDKSEYKLCREEVGENCYKAVISTQSDGKFTYRGVEYDIETHISGKYLYYLIPRGVNGYTISTYKLE